MLDIEKMNGIFETWQALDLRRKIVLVGALLLTMVAVLSLAQVATKPGMALLYSGLDPSAAGEVLGALEQMSVASEVRGDAIFVAENERDRVRLALAGDGLPRQGQAGYEVIDSLSPISTTSDAFNAAYWRAKEGELARTLLAMSGVRGARVHIAVPSRRPFARDGAEPTAAVTVTTASGTLAMDQANAIRHVVALAVTGLDPEQVAVIDSRRGMILSPGSESATANAASLAAEREDRLKAEIEQLLAARVGRDKARVTVTVETDREAETIVERRLDPESRVTIHSNVEEVTDASQGAAGDVTVASNLPDGDAAADPGNKSNRSETREQFNYDYTEIRRETVREAGAIRKISVAVLVDGIVEPGTDGTAEWRPRSDEELDSLRELVIAAVGYDEERGDIVTVESLSFQPDAIPGALIESSPIGRFLERNAMTLIQLGLLSAVALILALTVVRPLLRPQPVEDLGDGRTIDGALAAPGMDGDLETLSALPGELGTGDAEPDSDPVLSPVEQLRLSVAEDPERAVETLRLWLKSPDDAFEEQAA